MSKSPPIGLCPECGRSCDAPTIKRARRERPGEPPCRSHTAYRKGTLKGANHTTGDYPADTPPLPADYEAPAKQIVIARYRMAHVLNTALAR